MDPSDAQKLAENILKTLEVRPLPLLCINVMRFANEVAIARLSCLGVSDTVAPRDNVKHIPQTSHCLNTQTVECEWVRVGPGQDLLALVDYDKFARNSNWDHMKTCLES